MSISVCTLAHGRAEHLANLVRGLRLCKRPPRELVVAVMQERRYDLPCSAFPIRQIVLGSEGIPLARARNAAAEIAGGDLLVFLDVDCIPHPQLISDYAACAQRSNGVFMGEVAYLPRGATDTGIDYELFEKLGVTHAARQGPPAEKLKPCRDYRCFWSLNFAISAADFALTGGFDETYVGYGGEDTDYGRVIKTAGLPLLWARGAKAYHQYHPHHMPPVHHLDSVLANAHRFREKWGEPTMQHWLRAFVLMGLIERRGEGWVKLREPGEADFALTCQQADEPYADSAILLDWLEKRAAAEEESAGREPRMRSTAAPEIAFK